MMLRGLSRFCWLAAAILLVAGFVLAVARFHHPVYGFTALLQFDNSDEAHLLPEVRERPAFINRNNGGYDGLYYAQIACRPTLRDPALPKAIDNLGYRARRILPSWTAWVLALGNPVRALDMFAILNPLCWLALAGVLLWLFPLRSGHDFLAWSGLVLSAGALSSVRLALVDLPALLLLAAAMVAVQRERPRGAVGLFAAATLTRETSLFAVPVLARAPWRSFFLRSALIVAPFALWLVYIRVVVGPGDRGWSNFAWPGQCWVEKWQATIAGFSLHPELPLLNWTTLLALVGLSIQAAWFIARPQWQNLWWRLGASYTVLFLLLGTAVWEGYPGAAVRVLLPLNLAFNAFVPRTRAGLALLVLGNLTVPAGLVQITSLPNDGVELAAVRTDVSAVIVQTQRGWYGVERNARNFWSWSAGDADLLVRSKPVGTSQVLSFRLRSLEPRTVTITQDGHQLWQGPVSQTWAAVTLHCTDGILSFHSDQPPSRESAETSSRALAVCIDRVQITDVAVRR
ncbi:MAG TPA: hypothetical protein PLU52_00245 [Opitutaceae bacterium]|nr:hypothetical protein [Opitutaceae bacterium]HND60568.1 hypothetical protein [Opitutaceae bacterium]